MDNRDDELGFQDRADEAFLFTIARSPGRRAPLTELEEAAITAWSRGHASRDEENLARTAIRENLTAKELLLSRRLEQTVAVTPPVPRRVSRAIQRHIASSPRGRLQLPSFGTWRFAGVGAMALAAIVLAVIMRHPSHTVGARFQVASLSDRSVLDYPEGSVTRGGPVHATPGPGRPSLEFSDFDVPVGLLKQLVADGTQPVDPKAVAALTRTAPLFAHLSDDALPAVILDREIETTIKRGPTATMLTLRAYDLTAPANEVLLRSLHVPAGSKTVFVTLSP